MNKFLIDSYFSKFSTEEKYTETFTYNCTYYLYINKYTFAHGITVCNYAYISNLVVDSKIFLEINIHIFEEHTCSL